MPNVQKKGDTYTTEKDKKELIQKLKTMQEMRIYMMRGLAAVSANMLAADSNLWDSSADEFSMAVEYVGDLLCFLDSHDVDSLFSSHLSSKNG